MLKLECFYFFGHPFYLWVNIINKIDNFLMTRIVVKFAQNLLNLLLSSCKFDMLLEFLISFSEIRLDDHVGLGGYIHIFFDFLIDILELFFKLLFFSFIFLRILITILLVSLELLLLSLFSSLQNLYTIHRFIMRISQIIEVLPLSFYRDRAL